MIVTLPWPLAVARRRVVAVAVAAAAHSLRASAAELELPVAHYRSECQPATLAQRDST